jgi:glycosyltransferase involved in cell wall biosynthesis
VALPISAFIITRNEEARLPAALAALTDWIGEIIVVDSGSTDRTVDIAKAAGATVLHRKWTGYGPQKRFAEQHCRNEWVLNIDADEVITTSLAREIKGLFSAAKPPEPSAFKVRILTVYPGDAEPRPFANDYNVVRLYHRSAGQFRDHPVYDRVVLKNGTAPGQLEAPIFHHCYISFEHVIEKSNTFSSFRSAHSKPRSPTLLTIRLLTEFPVNFLKSYIFRRHCTGGWKGFYFSLCHAFMRTSRIAKMLEHSQWQETGSPASNSRRGRLTSESAALQK